ncbi:MAG: hypothetical protein BWX64_02758 [Acidobacteria bacterium ADurb.Bin051]|nr:MAG: hypothetical protein BWX64_02758 [Acidobacteria bacterium ADurb.Bin051]
MLKKPASGGIPAIATVATRNVPYVAGSTFARPPIFRMSCSPDSAWITEPAPRKSSALKNACVPRWKIAAVYAPTPAPTNMYPSCETVEYARTFLMSSCARPIVAANSAVAAPTDATKSATPGESW